MTTLVWLRQDLRLHDHAPLFAAAAAGPVVMCYVLDESTQDWAFGGASRWWLHHSLAAMHDALAKQNVRLILRRGQPLAEILRLTEEVKATKVVWHRAYTPSGIARDTAIKSALAAAGISAQSYAGHLLFEPWTIKNGSGKDFKVYTPFSRACYANADHLQPPLPMPPSMQDGSKNIASDTLESWNLLPTAPNWASGFARDWQPGEAGARQRWENFKQQGLQGYGDLRNRPDIPSTSRLSPYLHFGEISLNTLWHETRALMTLEPSYQHGAEVFIKELLWREFAYHLLYHQPQLPTSPLQTVFEKFPWREDATALRAWQRGQTGYPIVDAGMRELWQTGWMHNRVRMIVASFLIKHLLLHWRHGEDWFWDCLVDADLANNAASWQWVAGCGADAAPYFRIFNPILQGKKFDVSGDYVRRFVPELAKLPLDYLHAPWTAPASVLVQAGVVLGQNYPHPIVEHIEARDRALAALATIKQVDLSLQKDG